MHAHLTNSQGDLLLLALPIAQPIYAENVEINVRTRVSWCEIARIGTPSAPPRQRQQPGNPRAQNARLPEKSGYR